MPKSKKFGEIEFHEFFAVEETIITKASRNTEIHIVIQFHHFFSSFSRKKKIVCVHIKLFSHLNIASFVLKVDPSMRIAPYKCGE